MTRESYARSVLRMPTMELVAGLELRDGDVLSDLRADLRALMTTATGDDDLAVARCIERDVRARWPGRAFFFEVGDLDGVEWVQVYDPAGFVKERCDHGGPRLALTSLYLASRSVGTGTTGG